MSDNYKAWGVNIDDFGDLKNERSQLKFLLKFAVLAPSSHNSQPWQFKIGNGEIIIKPDFSRRLKFSDKNDRQLYTSLGCTLENILVAAKYYNFQTEVNIEKSPNENEYSIKIKFKKESNQKNSDEYIRLIIQRATNRNKHLMTSDWDSSFITKIGQKYSPDFKIDIVKERNLLLKITDLVIKAGIEAMDDKGFRIELSHYVKNNTSRSYVGMPCFGMGIPTILSYFAPIMIRFFNMNKLSKKTDRALLEKHTQSLLVITSKSDDIPSWIRTGQIYQEISLEALSHGLSTSPMAGIIQIGSNYKDLQKVLETDFRPQFFCRLGKSIGGVRHSQRLPVEKVLENLN